jgi:Protein of unknown function (DUF1559)
MTASPAPGAAPSAPRRKTWRRWLLFGMVVLAIPCGVWLPCIRQVRDGEGWTYSADRLKEIGLALHEYEQQHGELPPAVVTDNTGKPLYSWRVLLLPYLEQGHLFAQFNLNQPWNSPANSPLAAEAPKCYRLPLCVQDPPGLTHYQVLVGPGTAFEKPGLTWNDFPDGPANTLLVVEAHDAVPWSKPADLTYDPDQPLPPLGGLCGKPIHFLCYEAGRTPGFVACFGDAKVRFISNKTPAATIRGLITRDGGEKVDPSGLE